MATTYLQLINKALTRLRQDTVTEITDPYAPLVGYFVNQAKEDIEGQGPWKALRNEVTQASSSGTPSYTLAATNERTYLLYDPQGRPLAFETTTGNKHRMTVVQWEELRNLIELDTNPANDRPQYVSFNKTNAGLIAKFYPTPDAIYSYKFVCVVPQAELAVKTTEILIPARPVWLLAAAYAAKERGEELSGTDYATMLREAQRAVEDAALTDYGSDASVYTPD